MIVLTTKLLVSLKAFCDIWLKYFLRLILKTILLQHSIWHENNFYQQEWSIKYLNRKYFKIVCPLESRLNNMNFISRHTWCGHALFISMFSLHGMPDAKYRGRGFLLSLSLEDKSTLKKTHKCIGHVGSLFTWKVVALTNVAHIQLHSTQSTPQRSVLCQPI